MPKPLQTASRAGIAFKALLALMLGLLAPSAAMSDPYVSGNGIEVVAQAGGTEDGSTAGASEAPADEEELFFGEEQKERTYPSRSLTPEQKPRNWEARVNLGGYWENEVGVDTVQDNQDEDMIDFRSKIFGYGSYKFSDKTSLNLSLLTYYWLLEGGNDRQQASFDLYEGYLAFHFKKADLFAGQMLARWGVCDLLSPLDAVNPTNFRSFIDPDREDLRIPLPMFRVEAYHDNLTLDALYIPIFQSAILDLAGTDLSLVDTQGKVPIIPPVYQDILGPKANASLIKTVNYKEERLLTGEIGARMIYNSGTTRIELVFFSTREDFPFLMYKEYKDKNNNTLGTTSLEFDRYQMYGLAYKGHFSGVDLRVEYAYSPERTLTKSSKTPIGLNKTTRARMPWEALAVEADYLDPDTRYFIKLGAEQVTYVGAPENLASGSGEYIFLLAAIRFYLLDNALSPELRTVNIQSDSNLWYISPRIAYRFQEKYSLTTGMNLYTGTGTGGPGVNANTFSPITVLSKNNQIFVSFRWIF